MAGCRRLSPLPLPVMISNRDPMSDSPYGEEPATSPAMRMQGHDGDSYAHRQNSCLVGVGKLGFQVRCGSEGTHLLSPPRPGRSDGRPPWREARSYCGGR